MQVGKQSISFENPPVIEAAASVAGAKEGEGPLGKLFDVVEDDPMFHMNTWEEAESNMQTMTLAQLFSKSKYTKEDIRYLFAGDLLGQLIATSFGVEEYEIPLFGLYGACSTFGESMALGAMTVAAGYADRVIAMASSHFASAEKQFRFPLEYGNQRPLSATWTATGCGAVIIGNGTGKNRISGITTGKIADYGVKDSMNMGACMAPAAAETIATHFKDFGIQPDYYDMIFTGDLGYVGKTIITDLLKEKGYDISSNYSDCGIELFDQQTQDTHSGGSGCGCSAITFTSYILRQMDKKIWKRVLLVPTGALLSTVSFNEGKSVPGIAHAVVVENCH